MYKDIISMFLAIAGVLLIIIFTYIASKWYAGKMGAVSGGKHIKIIDRVMVGKGGTIMIIDVEGSQYLIGANEHNITIMKELEETIEINDKSTMTREKFKEYLTQYIYKREKND